MTEKRIGNGLCLVCRVTVLAGKLAHHHRLHILIDILVIVIVASETHLGRVGMQLILHGLGIVMAGKRVTHLIVLYRLGHLTDNAFGHRVCHLHGLGRMKLLEDVTHCVFLCRRVAVGHHCLYGLHKRWCQWMLALLVKVLSIHLPILVLHRCLCANRFLLMVRPALSLCLCAVPCLAVHRRCGFAVPYLAIVWRRGCSVLPCVGLCRSPNSKARLYPHLLIKLALSRVIPFPQAQARCAWFCRPRLCSGASLWRRLFRRVIIHAKEYSGSPFCALPKIREVSRFLLALLRCSRCLWFPRSSWLVLCCRHAGFCRPRLCRSSIVRMQPRLKLRFCADIVIAFIRQCLVERLYILLVSTIITELLFCADILITGILQTIVQLADIVCFTWHIRCFYFFLPKPIPRLFLPLPIFVPSVLWLILYLAHLTAARRLFLFDHVPPPVPVPLLLPTSRPLFLA